MTSAEPERHGREEARAAATAAAVGCQVISDDVKLPGTVSSTLDTGSTSAASAAGASGPPQSKKTTSSAGSDKKAVHKIPKPGMCFYFLKNF